MIFMKLFKEKVKKKRVCAMLHEKRRQSRIKGEDIHDERKVLFCMK